MTKKFRLSVAHKASINPRGRRSSEDCSTQNQEQSKINRNHFTVHSNNLSSALKKVAVKGKNTWTSSNKRCMPTFPTTFPSKFESNSSRAQIESSWAVYGSWSRRWTSHKISQFLSNKAHKKLLTLMLILLFILAYFEYQTFYFIFQK